LRENACIKVSDTIDGHLQKALFCDAFGTGATRIMENTDSHQKHLNQVTLVEMLGAIGIVFGDIGASPLYSPHLNTIPIVLAILVALFVAQQFGTQTLGRFFGPPFVYPSFL
jgi:K+ transporter